MKKNLYQIAEIVSGYTFRESIENDAQGDIFVLQAKNIFKNTGISSTNTLIKISSKTLRNPYFIKHNDIVIVSRGSGPGSFRSAVFTLDEDNIMSSSSVHIIRIKDVTVLPKYISLYLNSLEGQKSLSQIVTGTSYIQSLLVKNLSELEIPIPPLHIQKSFISLAENIATQEKLLKRKQELTENILNVSFPRLNNYSL